MYVVFHYSPPVYDHLCRWTVLHPHHWTIEATPQRAASRPNPQVPWFPCLGEAWAGQGVLAGPCVCCLDGCLEVCVSLSQLWGPTSGSTHMTMCSCMNCWAWAVLCSAWCTRCWDRSTRSPSWPSSSSSATSSHKSGGGGLTVVLSGPVGPEEAHLGLNLCSCIAKNARKRPISVFPTFRMSMLLWFCVFKVQSVLLSSCKSDSLE